MPPKPEMAEKYYQYISACEAVFSPTIPAVVFEVPSLALHSTEEKAIAHGGFSFRFIGGRTDTAGFCPGLIVYKDTSASQGLRQRPLYRLSEKEFQGIGGMVSFEKTWKKCTARWQDIGLRSQRGQVALVEYAFCIRVLDCQDDEAEIRYIQWLYREKAGKDCKPGYKNYKRQKQQRLE